MKILTCFISLLLLFPAIVIPDDVPNTKGVITLINNGFGHACPCDGKVYTAGHVVEPGYGKEELRAFTWEDGYGNGGKAEGKSRDDYRDLATLDLKGGPSIYYPRARTLPEEKDKVYWEEFENNSYLSKVQDADVMYLKAGYIFFDKQPNPGASGSCLFNSMGEVVGIVVWGFYKDGKRFGAATTIVEK